MPRRQRGITSRIARDLSLRLNFGPALEITLSIIAWEINGQLYLAQTWRGCSFGLPSNSSSMSCTINDNRSSAAPPSALRSEDCAGSLLLAPKPDCGGADKRLRVASERIGVRKTS